MLKLTLNTASNSLTVNKVIFPLLKIIPLLRTHSAVCLSVPLDEETGAVPDDHPLQMRRHDEPENKKNINKKIDNDHLTAS